MEHIGFQIFIVETVESFLQIKSRTELRDEKEMKLNVL